MTDHADDLLTVTEIANRWGVSKQTVYRFIKDGTLPGFRFGKATIRVRRGDLDTYEAAASTVETTP